MHGPASIRFRPDGKRFFIVSHAHSGTQRVLQVTLTNAYDTSSYVIDGSFVIKNLSGYNNSQPRGIAFSENGLKMYITKDRSKAPDINLDQKSFFQKGYCGYTDLTKFILLLSHMQQSLKFSSFCFRIMYKFPPNSKDFKEHVFGHFEM